MSQKSSRLRLVGSWLAVLFVAGLLVGTANVGANSATGDNFKLGKWNAANKPSTIKRWGWGPALALRTAPNAPPMWVNSNRKVARFNADRVDNRHAWQLETHSRKYSIPVKTDVSTFVLALDDLAPGIYQASFSVSANMSTTGATLNCSFRNAGGGGYEVMGYGSTYASFSTSNGFGVIDARSNDKEFRCFTSGGTANVGTTTVESQVVMTRIDGLQSGSFAAPRIAPRPAPPGAGG